MHTLPSNCCSYVSDLSISHREVINLKLYPKTHTYEKVTDKYLPKLLDIKSVWKPQIATAPEKELMTENEKNFFGYKSKITKKPVYNFP